jgi:hypothetical protein
MIFTPESLYGGGFEVKIKFCKKIFRGSLRAPKFLPCMLSTYNFKEEMQLRGLHPNFYIHVSVIDLCIPTIGPQTQFSKIGGPIVGIYK